MIQGFQGRTELVAVFVDGDNLRHEHADEILSAATQRGAVGLCRVYGDMAKLPDWSGDPRFAPQHAPSVRGKNNADIRLVIDAVEYALAGRARVFVIASNDGDFGPLAARLRELGFVVVGVGGARPARTFAVACTSFVRIEEVVVSKPDVAVKTSVIPKITVAKRTAISFDPLDTLIRERIVMQDKAGIMPLNILGSFLGSPKPYGASTWRGVIGARPDRYLLEGKGNATVVRMLPDAMPAR